MSDNNDLLRLINADETQLNALFKEVLDGLRDDIIEAQDNVDLNFEEMKTKGPEMFGTLYNDSLKVKGAARARQLTFLSTFKERVAKKEERELAKEMTTKGSSIGKLDHSDMNKLLDEMQKSGDLSKLELDFGKQQEDDE